MIEFKQEFITPERAIELLNRNTHNRKARLTVVHRYSQEILKGNWQENTGESIKISDRGRILDGQHRLMAIVKANQGVNFHIAYGINDNAFSVIDIGANRTAADIFHIGGAKNAHIIPPAIQAWILIKKGFHLKPSRNGSLTSQELLSIYEQNPQEWQDVADKTSYWFTGFSKILPLSLIGGLYKAFKDRAGEEIALDFMNQLCYGREISNDTIVWVRKRLTEDKISKMKINRNIKVSLIVRAWNLYREGKQVKKLNITNIVEPIL